MKIISRRAALGFLATLFADSTFLVGKPWAQSRVRSAVLVGKAEKLPSNPKMLNRLTVCAGRAGSTSDIVARQNGALVFSVGSMSRRIAALESGRCDALIFVSSTESVETLKEEIRVFFPQLKNYALLGLPTG